MSQTTYPRSAPPRTCGCGARVGRKSQTGRCQPCSRKPDRDALLAAIRTFYVQHGRVPTAAEWQPREPGRPTTNHLAYAFGTFNAAIRAAGFTPRRKRGPDRIERSPRSFATTQEELAYLVAEQEKDHRFRFRSYAIDPLSSRFKRGTYVSDTWTVAVAHLVDFRREIDRWAEAA